MPLTGWIPPEHRTEETKLACAQAVAEMAAWELVGDDWGIEKAFLWEVARKAHGGKDIPTLAQATGSCVGNGAWNAVMYLMAFEIIRLGQAEEVKTIFLPYHYGRGRYHAGIRGRGDGSTGSGQAKAVKVDGVIPQDLPGLPTPSSGDGLTWGRSAELEWSAGERIQEKWIQEGRKFPVQETRQVHSAADVKAAICNGYPVTIASDWGGKMKPPISDGVLLNHRADRWAHQMAILGWQRHASHGEIFYVMNSWGKGTHGVCPSGAPDGGFWVKAKEVDYITAQDDSFAYANLAGFPAQTDIWSLV